MKRIGYLLLSVFLLAPAASAAELAGVTLPDKVEVGGKSLQLNGLGLREATFLKVDVYVAGLYLETKSKDANAILGSDGPAQLQMKFVRDVGKDSMVEAWEEGFPKNTSDVSALKDRIETLNGWMQDIADGDTMTFTYVPGTGVTVAIKGDVKGTVEGADFAKAFWAIFIGKKPPNSGLKKGLLGG